MRKALLGVLLAAVCVLVQASSFAQEKQDEVDVEGLMKNFFAASDAKAKSQAVSLIRFAQVDVLDIEKRLRKGREYPKDAKTGWQVIYNRCSDGKERPYHLFVPEDYDPAKKYPVFYDLHGGVSRPAIVPVEQLVGRRRLWGALAAEKGFILIIPHGEGSATWWSKVGADNVLAQLDYAKRHYNVDEDRAFLSGFSDGASGAYWMALHRPTAFAGFIPLSGSLVVPRAGPYQCYPRNLLSRPVHATNGGQDTLYPSAGAKKLIDQLGKAGITIDWTAYPEAGHDMSYFDKEMPRVMEFTEKTARKPLRTHVVWETADTEVGRCDWVRIDEIKDIGNNSEFKDLNLIVEPGPVRIGVYVDQQYNGVGVRIQGVLRNSPAAQLGLAAGDIITKLDDTDIKDFNDLRKVLGAKNHGDKITGEYTRGAEAKKFSGQFPQEKPEPAYRRTKTAGSIEAKADGNTIDVKVKNVARYTLFVNREQFDLDKPVKIVTNGEESFNDAVKPDLVFMLEQYAADNDRTMVYCAKIEIKVPEKEAKDEGKEGEEEKPEEDK